MDINQLPEHIAIIMDGNGRWAKKRLQNRALGHSQGAKTFEKIASYANSIGLKHLTVYAFSTDNWKREESEKKAIFHLLEHYLDRLLSGKEKEEMRIDFIGNLSVFSGNLLQKIKRVADLTKDKSGLCLHIALNYGGREEILHAAKNACKEGVWNEDLFRKHLYTNDIPDPDLIIRTSGEMRLSNFLTFQSVYSELYFTDVLWPDFKKEHLMEAICDFQKRERRFGGRKE